MLTGGAEMNPPVDFLTFLRFRRMQKALLYWVMMQCCLTADHLGMKWGFNPSVFKYWRLCFQQAGRPEAFTERYFMRCFWMTPALEVQGGNELWKWLVAHGKHFWGAALPWGWVSGFLWGWCCCPPCKGAFLPSARGSAASRPMPLQRQSLVAFSVLEGSYWKRKPCFQGEGQP